MDGDQQTVRRNGTAPTKVLDQLRKYNGIQRSDDRVGETNRVQRSSGRGKAHPIMEYNEVTTEWERQTGRREVQVEVKLTL